MSMNIKDLRVGNLVYSPLTQEPFTISLLDVDRGTTLSCEPIPLTESWLERLGFSKEPFEPSSIEEGYYYSLSLSDAPYCDLALLSDYDEEGDDWTVYLFPYDNLVYRYVHEVQNIVHSISGRDIDIIAGQ